MSTKKSRGLKTKKINSPAAMPEDDFVFPVFENQPTKQKFVRKNSRNEARLSPYLLDLKKNRQKQAPPTFIPFPVYFDPENWFVNFPELNPFNYPALPKNNKQQPLNYLRPRQGEDARFALPDAPEPLSEKIKFHRPAKEKIKHAVKLNFHQPVFKEKNYQLSSPAWQIIKKVASAIFYLISSPFKALDFLVDRTLKGVWFLIKFVARFIASLFISLYRNLLTLFFPRRALTEALPREKTKTNSQFFLFLRVSYKPILSFVFICLLIVLPLQILNLKQKKSVIQGQVLGRSIEGFEFLKEGSLASQNFDFQTALNSFGQAYLNFQLAQNYLENLDLATQQLIKLVPEGSQADQLLITGQLAAQLGRDFSQAFAEIQNSKLELLEKLKTIQEILAKIEPNFLELVSQLQRLQIEKISNRLSADDLKKLALFQTAAPAIKENFQILKNLANFLLNFLGETGEKKYLVIFQNNSELRPTGGFMGSYALVEIKQGKIVKMEVPGGGFYDLKAANQISVVAPKPFQLFSPNWQIWNANWFPDWPASAEKIDWFYENSLSGVSVDGILSLTPNVIEDLLKMTGPIELPAYKKTITAENFVPELQMAVEIEYDKQENKPKQIIADLMPVVLERIFNLQLNQAPQFLQILNQNLKQKNILIWLKDENLLQTADAFGWTGRLKNTAGDYLSIIHTNIGGGKTDRVIKNTVRHLVEIDKQGDIFDTVTLTRKHEGRPTDIFENQNNVDYVRFYVPAGSKLITATGFDVIPANLFKPVSKNLAADNDLLRLEENPILEETSNTRITQEFGKTCFGNWLLVKPGEEKTVAIKYQLPFKIAAASNNIFKKLWLAVTGEKEKTLPYQLIVQKQAGVGETNFTSTLQLPIDRKVTAATADTEEIKNNNQAFIYQSNLTEDGYYNLEIE